MDSGIVMLIAHAAVPDGVRGTESWFWASLLEGWMRFRVPFDETKDVAVDVVRRWPTDQRVVLGMLPRKDWDNRFAQFETSAK